MDWNLKNKVKVEVRGHRSWFKELKLMVDGPSFIVQG
jgi:hypothetical protein